jgi:uncharacterized membrane protein
MKNKYVRWLYEELPVLVNRGVLSAESVEKIHGYYGTVGRHDGRRLMMRLFGVLGAALIGSGIILLLAHNWEELSRPVRAAVSVIPLVVSQALAGWVLLKRRESAAWRCSRRSSSCGSSTASGILSLTALPL